MRSEIERLKKEEKEEKKEEALLLGYNIIQAMETLVALDREYFDEEGIFLFVRKGGVVSSEVLENTIVGGLKSKVYKVVDLSDVTRKLMSRGLIKGSYHQLSRSPRKKSRTNSNK